MPETLRAAVAAPAAGRDPRLDVLRGLSLVMIFINHVPGNVYEKFTSRNFGFSDAAEGFVLMSGIAAGLAYSLPMLIESRLSPQMNVWVYGFFQHDFFQTIRQGGYRPVVFLPHGLWVAFFALMCLVAAMVRLRAVTAEARPKAFLVLCYLAFMLFLCKSAGPMVYALGLAPLVLLTPWRWQIVVAAILAAAVRRVCGGSGCRRSASSLGRRSS